MTEESMKILNEKNLQIMALEKEIRNLQDKQQEKIQRIQVIKEIIPADYGCLKKQLKQQEKEIAHFREIISFGQISTLDNMIDDYIIGSRSKLKKIVLELQLTDFDKQQIKPVMELLDYLSITKDEIFAIISLSQEAAFHQIITDVNIINHMLSKNNVVDFDNHGLGELHDLLVEFIQRIKIFYGGEEVE